MATTQTGTVYMVEAGEYEDRRVLVIAVNREAAQRYADHHNVQRNRTTFAEVSEAECIPADWAPPVTEAPTEFCGNCHAECASDCYCAVPIGDDGMSAEAESFCEYTAGCAAQTPPITQISTTYLAQLQLYAQTHCPGCPGAGTGRRCCICGGLR